MTLNSVGEVSQCGVDGAHVAQLSSLRKLALGLSRQQHTLFVARQCVGVVADSCVHMAQTAESSRRSLKSQIHTTYSTLVTIHRPRSKVTVTVLQKIFRPVFRLFEYYTVVLFSCSNLS